MTLDLSGTVRGVYSSLKAKNLHFSLPHSDLMPSLGVVHMCYRPPEGSTFYLVPSYTIQSLAHLSHPSRRQSIYAPITSADHFHFRATSSRYRGLQEGLPLVTHTYKAIISGLSFSVALCHWSSVLYVCVRAACVSRLISLPV